MYVWLIHFQVDDELEIKAYYAGHVLGAAMFQMRVGNQSVVYTVSYKYLLGAATHISYLSPICTWTTNQRHILLCCLQQFVLIYFSNSFYTLKF